MEASCLRAQVAQARRRRDGARLAAVRLRAEAESLRRTLDAARAAGRAAGAGELQVGSQVRIMSCQEAPQLAQQCAQVVAKDAKRGRCKVRLQTGEQRQVPISCLALADDGSGAAAATGAAGASPRPGRAAGAEGGAMQGWARDPPLLSASNLRLRSCLPPQAGSTPCELWPLVSSGLLRTEVAGDVRRRLCRQLDAACAAARHAGGGGAALDNGAEGIVEVRIERIDAEFVALLLQMCNQLACAFLGHHGFRCELERVWGVVQREGDYNPLQAHRNAKSPWGFSSILDLQLPSALGAVNHDLPTKGACGFHDGLHNFIWKGDRTTDKDDLIQPGIIQCELAAGYLYVFPQWLQHLTWPFEGEGERKWVAANVALCDVSPNL